ncbi:putative porin [Sinomicrobium weinanense]|uniref:Porin n=1 Tax=Sinomicrobium weinanense TaxID=2842200 RepID=A0A926JVT3_9FLAO|nr:putative porin [Sinomicrobium weinanense]MBC9798497.1 putative porin [Sinomicrobium weinanense]MBU3126010.1 putative porin [Sinomicrobium weinanense]
MKRIFFLCALLFFTVIVKGQEKNFPEKKGDTVSRSRKPGGKGKSVNDTVADIKDYKIISYKRDTTYLDTSLTIDKEYRYNYLRRDNFELLPFSNMGQTYNSLAKNFRTTGLYPELGARSKHFNYMEAEDINYYSVPTPTTDLLFKTTMEQGQLLDAFITMNTSRRLNFSIAYKGMRSLGKYQHTLSSTGNFRVTTNYTTKDNKYRMRAHFTAQDILNQENGGISNRDQFESGEPEFSDRARMDVFFENAENLLIGKRYFLDHEYFLVRPGKAFSRLSFGHEFQYETKFYKFLQESADEDYFGAAYQPSDLEDRARLKTMYNQLSLNYGDRIFGDLKFKASHYNYNYFFNTVIYSDDGVIGNKLNGDEIAIGGEWAKTIGRVNLNADIEVNMMGDLSGNTFNGTASYDISDDLRLSGFISSTARMPNYNFLLYLSDYKNYNWQNDGDFGTEKVYTLGGTLRSKKWGSITASYATIDDYTYFYETADAEDQPNMVLSRPAQYGGTISYLKVKGENEFRLGKFALRNTIMYQNVAQDDLVMNTPEFITRNTLYYSNDVFKKAMFLQVGITFKYFTEYYADGYNPLLGEFYTQTREKIGGFPLADFFINARVRQTRIYLKAEHFNSSFTGYDYYSAPNNPYRDFIVRFGLVWNFFR